MARAQYVWKVYLDNGSQLGSRLVGIASSIQEMSDKVDSYLKENVRVTGDETSRIEKIECLGEVDIQ